jgi:Fe-S oxidoreductase
VPIIVQMRRKLVEDGAMDPLLTKTLQTIHKTGNSFGESKRKRGAWSKPLPFKIKDARKEPVDVLWFVGDYASFDPRNQKVTQTFAALLQPGGGRFGILYDGESNAGNDVRRVGEEGLYEVLAGANIAALEGASFKTIVTTDPAFLQYHPQRISLTLAANTRSSTTRASSGSCSPTVSSRWCSRSEVRATFHDPCHLGRFNKGYEAPRELLKLLGCELVEMGRCRDNSFCCGAGGGRIWIPDPVGRRSRLRIGSAKRRRFRASRFTW